MAGSGSISKSDFDECVVVFEMGKVVIKIWRFAASGRSMH